ncbi:uncharacterized protein LOC127251584 [Andrographis paniculata]|uniref:uncharacterized protein LOC127251584 n=1 Tax=Andrographis paniculata TaxID=175694 RepID=UPI0021E7F236|nr:uncharacterized protein LOC127251584 [Andrographis paniculata]
MGRDGSKRRRRKNPQIKALDAPPSTSTRTTRTIKRKFDDAAAAAAATPVSKLAKQVWKGRNSPRYGRRSTDSCVLIWKSSHGEHHKQDGGTGKALILPEKHTLELVLDTLQRLNGMDNRIVLEMHFRRDTYEIFAEPVNPDEVEDYYKIIKEPMDFGTMRAKLHEGMYENLEQFERDVFLIPENAMHFNSSGTTYFRQLIIMAVVHMDVKQARAMHELAKKVFEALRVDPENFVMEFSGARRRSMRKALGESKDSRPPAAAMDEARDAFPKETPTFRRSSGIRRTAGCSAETSPTALAHHHHANCSDSNLLFATATGRRDGRVSSSQGADDRRSTYRMGQRRSSLFKHAVDSTASFPHTCNQLVSTDCCTKCTCHARTHAQINQVDIISYRSSLMSFVKGLGPTAQMIAWRKLVSERASFAGKQSAKCHQRQSEESLCSEATTHRAMYELYPGKRQFFTEGNKADSTGGGGGEEAKAKEKAKGEGDLPEKQEQKIDATALTTTRNKIRRGFKYAGKSDHDANSVRPVILALESSHSKGGAAENRSKNRKSSTTLPWNVSPTPTPSLSQSQSQGDSVGQLQLKEEAALAMRPAPAADPSATLTTSQFTFNLSFLKARLDQMNGLVVGAGGERLKKGPSSDKLSIVGGGEVEVRPSRESGPAQQQATAIIAG